MPFSHLPALLTTAFLDLGHVWVTLAVLASHPDGGAIALPVQAQLYLRAADLDKLPPERPD